jgi:hypothetical protein
MMKMVGIIVNKCEYCGNYNKEERERCYSCGAPCAENSKKESNHTQLTDEQIVKMSLKELNGWLKNRGL